MNWPQTINTLIFVIGTFASVLEAIYLSHIWMQKLPEHTRVALEQFANQAVRQVEQQSATLSGPAKKQLAIAAVAKLFEAFGIPIPAATAVDIAIEAAVLLLPTSKIETPKSNG